MVRKKPNKHMFYFTLSLKSDSPIKEVFNIKVLLYGRSNKLLKVFTIHPKRENMNISFERSWLKNEFAGRCTKWQMSEAGLRITVLKKRYPTPLYMATENMGFTKLARAFLRLIGHYQLRCGIWLLAGVLRKKHGSFLL